MHRRARVLALSACSLSACVSDVGGDIPGATGTTGGTTSGTTTTTGGDETSESTVVGPTTMPDAVTSTTGVEPPPAGRPTDPNLLVALVGDQGSGSNTRAVYRLIRDEGADMLIVLGDFDYEDDPDAWAAEMDDVLGDSFPVFAVVGNHDVEAWDGYQAKLQDRLARVPGATCEGDLGVASSCRYRGLHFLLSGFGTLAFGVGHEQWLADALKADDSLWSLCAWHKNQRDLQAGDKGDEVSWQALKNCQDNAAIVVMGHEHSYARTLTLTDVGHAAAGHGAVGLPELMEVGEGRTFTACSGLGGASIRDYDPALHDDDTWWSTIYTGDYHLRNGVQVQEFSADYGALFMRFHVGGDPAAAHGYFKNVQGEVVDEFDVVRK